MHFCNDELNAAITALPFLEHLARYARQGWRWAVARVGGR